MSSKLQYKGIASVRGSHFEEVTKTLNVLGKNEDGSFEVRPNEVIVKVHSVSLNPADLVLHRSSWMMPFHKHLGIGSDYSGTIKGIGNAAKSKLGLNVEDQVSGLYFHPLGEGALAEYLILDLNNEGDCTVMKKPSRLSMEEASSFPVILLTAYQMIREHLKEESYRKVLVIGGATSVGRACVQLCRYFKVDEIHAVCSDKSAALVTNLGAHHIIDYKKHANINKPVREAAREGRYDAILDCCGNRDLFGNIHEILKPKDEGAYYVTISGDTKYDYSTMSVVTLFMPMVRSCVRAFLSRFGLSSLDYLFLMMDPKKKDLETIKGLIEAGELKLFLDEIFSYADFRKAVAKLESGKVSGKVVVRV